MEMKEAHMRLSIENIRLEQEIVALENKLYNVEMDVRKDVLLDVAKKLGFVHAGIIK